MTTQIRHIRILLFACSILLHLSFLSKVVCLFWLFLYRICLILFYAGGLPYSFIRFSIFFSSRETCTCDMPSLFPVSDWVLFSKYLR